MRGHSIVSEMHPTQSLVHGTFRHWLSWRPKFEEHTFLRTADGLGGSQYLDRLVGQWDGMFAPLLHPVDRDDPHLSFEVDLTPLRFSNFTWPLKYVCRKLHGQPRYWLSFVTVDRDQQPPEFFSFADWLHVAIAWR